MRIGLVAYAAALLLSGSELAYGQTAPAPSANDKNCAVLETVVVTATRRAENVQNVPVAVTALTASELNGSGISGVRGVTVAVPDFNGGRNFIGLQPTIRGVGSSGVSIGDEANVALYVDGVYMPVSQSNTIDLVEVD